MQVKHLFANVLQLFIYCRLKSGYLPVTCLAFLLFLTAGNVNAQSFGWAKSMGGSVSDVGMGIAVDGSGNMYVTGYYSSPIADFNPGGSGGMLTSAGLIDVFLAKYDTDGSFLWAKSMGGSSIDWSYNVAVDKSSNVYMTGYFNSDTADFNPGGSGGKLISASVAGDVFLAKYDASGSFLWAKNMGGVLPDYGTDVGVDGSGNVYVAGYINSATVEFNPGGSGGTLITNGNADVFVTKYDAAGGFLWAKNMGGSNFDNGYGMAVDKSGNVYVTGQFNSATANFNPGGSGGMLTNVGGYDAFIAKYDAGGSFLWAKNMGGNSDDAGFGLAVDGSGNVHVSGYFNSATADFNPGGNGGALTTAGGLDMFLAKYDAGGNYLWAKSMGGSSDDYGGRIAVDGSGNVYGTGYFGSATADFNPGGGGGTLTNAGGNNIFVVKFGCNDTSSSYLPVSFPCGESYVFNDSVYTAGGTYTHVFPNVFGCDSTVTLDLTIMPIDKPVINVDGFVLGVTGTYATYQWIKDGVPIPGATGSTYTVTTNGNYQVIVTDEKGCSDTSDVYAVTNTGIEGIHALANQIRVYPNPAHDLVYIQSPVKVQVRITDIAGKTIKEQANATLISLSELAKGMYLLNITDKEGVLLKVEKLLKAGVQN